MGFEHIGPFAGPRAAVPQGHSISNTPTSLNAGEHESQSNAWMGWAAGETGREVWRLSCEAVGLRVKAADQDKAEDKKTVEEKHEAGKQAMKKKQ